MIEMRKIKDFDVEELLAKYDERPDRLNRRILEELKLLNRIDIELMFNSDMNYSNKKFIYCIKQLRIVVSEEMLSDISHDMYRSDLSINNLIELIENLNIKTFWLEHELKLLLREKE
jgi:hypothetical protein